VRERVRGALFTLSLPALDQRVDEKETKSREPLVRVALPGEWRAVLADVGQISFDPNAQERSVLCRRVKARRVGDGPRERSRLSKFLHRGEHGG
jgi:hypothetical protein